MEEAEIIAELKREPAAELRSPKRRSLPSHRKSLKTRQNAKKTVNFVYFRAFFAKNLQKLA